jgi:hypothetical protein
MHQSDYNEDHNSEDRNRDNFNSNNHNNSDTNLNASIGFNRSRSRSDVSRLSGVGDRIASGEPFPTVYRRNSMLDQFEMDLEPTKSIHPLFNM